MTPSTQQQGPPDLDDLSRVYSRDVYSLVRRFIADPEEALDLTQEVLLRVCLRRQKFRCESAFTTWLYRIVLNSCRDERRKKARRKVREVLMPVVEETATPATHVASADTPAPLEALLARERAEQLDHLIDALPPDEYTVVVLHYYTGLPQKRVAEVLKVGLSTVELRLRRARSRLRQSLMRPEGAVLCSGTQGDQYLTLGRLLLQLRDYEAALPHCEKAVALMPDNVDALCALATACWRELNYDAAWEMTQRALRIDPDAGEAQNLCGIHHALHQRREEAIAAFHRAAADECWHARERAYNNLGVTCLEMRRWRDAVAPLRQAIALNPSYAVAYTHLGNAYLKQKKYDEALSCQDRATELDPDFFQAHFNRGQVLEQRGDLEAAAEAYRRASDLALWWLDPHAALGLLLHQQGKLAEAEARFTTALSIQANAGSGLYYKARIHLVRGNADTAFALFQKLSDESPEWAEPLLWLARLHEQRGDVAASGRALRLALEREPENEEVKERLKALRKRTTRRQAAQR